MGQPRVIAAVHRAVEIERNATDNLAVALTQAYNAGWSIRALAAETGLSKSRIDRLLQKQQRFYEVASR